VPVGNRRHRQVQGLGRVAIFDDADSCCGFRLRGVQRRTRVTGINPFEGLPLRRGQAGIDVLPLQFGKPGRFLLLDLQIDRRAQVFDRAQPLVERLDSAFRGRAGLVKHQQPLGPFLLSLGQQLPEFDPPVGNDCLQLCMLVLQAGKLLDPPFLRREFAGELRDRSSQYLAAKRYRLQR